MFHFSYTNGQNKYLIVSMILIVTMITEAVKIKYKSPLMLLSSGSAVIHVCVQWKCLYPLLYEFNLCILIFVFVPLQNETEKLQSQLASVRSQQSRDAEKHQLMVSSLNEQLKG